MLQLAVQFAYDFALHAALPSELLLLRAVCSGTWNYAHRSRAEVDGTRIYHGPKGVVGCWNVSQVMA